MKITGVSKNVSNTHLSVLQSLSGFSRGFYISCKALCIAFSITGATYIHWLDAYIRQRWTPLLPRPLQPQLTQLHHFPHHWNSACLGLSRSQYKLLTPFAHCLASLVLGRENPTPPVPDSDSCDFLVQCLDFQVLCFIRVYFPSSCAPVFPCLRNRFLVFQSVRVKILSFVFLVD